MENNYDILGTHEGATPKEIQEAFRRLALKHHSDRGGSIEQFKRIKQAYEDLKQGKKYPDREASRAYSGDDEEEARRRNRILAEELATQMERAQEWAAALARGGATGTRLFGSKHLGEMEFERKANGVLSIKGNVMAGGLAYDGPITIQGNITSPTHGGAGATSITANRGDFKLVNPLENKYKIENGSQITARNGNIVVGNIFGKKSSLQDPEGRVGLYITREHRTRLHAPHGKIIAENIANTVSLEADSIMVLNMEDDVKIRGREILIYGNKITYDVEIELAPGGVIKFFDRYSVLGFSDDAVIRLGDGRTLRLHDLKTRRISDIPGVESRGGGAETMVGNGFAITYEMLEGLCGPSPGPGWAGRLGLGRRRRTGDSQG